MVINISKEVSKENKTGAFVCLVGIDGSGKTSNTIALCKNLSSNGIKCSYVRPRYALLDYVPSILRKRIIKKQTLTPRSKCAALETSGPKAKKSKAELMFLTFYGLLTYYLCLKPLARERVLVADRYFYDWFYNGMGQSSLFFGQIAS